jgi:hypothetical protein
VFITLIQRHDIPPTLLLLLLLLLLLRLLLLLLLLLCCRPQAATLCSSRAWITTWPWSTQQHCSRRD